MMLSGVVLTLVLGVFLSFGRQAIPSETHTPGPACHRPEILLSYLDIDRYNKSYPYVDYEDIVKPAVDYMLKREIGPSNAHYDIYFYWKEVCKARDPVEEDAAWRNLAQELTHRMHTHESVLKISRMLFGDRIGGWLMNPPSGLAKKKQCFNNTCANQLADVFVEHCGEWNFIRAWKYIDTFAAMCFLGVQEDEFVDAVLQICGDYSYISNPPPGATW